MTIEVSSWTDLDAIRNDLTEDYVLTTDLDSNDGDYSGIGDDFEPIGDLFSTDWTLDGQGHEIRDLVISDTDQSVGLCRGVGEIRNLGVVDADVNNPNSLSDRQSTGILIGSTGGGPTIENCYSSGSVDAAEEDVGGLIGTMTSSGTTVRSCFSSATVTTDNGFCGGLVGLVFNGTVQSCYTLGSVASPSVKGGFVGENNGEIRECWSATSLTGGGGFVGLSFGDEIGCFWNTDVGPDTTDGDATGLTTSEMQGLGVETTMSPLRYVADFSRVVGGDNADADGYPILRSVPIAPQDDAQTASISDYLTVVTGLSAVVTNTADGRVIDLDWTDQAVGEDGFRVYRAADTTASFPDGFEALATTDPNVESFRNDENLLEDDYVFRVVAVEDDVESDPTDAVSESVGAAVADLAADAFDDDGTAVCDLTWTDRVAGSHSFRVYRSTDSDPTFPDDFAVVLQPATDTESARDEPLDVETAFTYRLTATQDDVESEPTDPASVETTPVGPFVVEIVDTNSPVGVGETLELDVDVTNQGEFSDETTATAELTEQ